jgi:hypothetical protein
MTTTTTIRISPLMLEFLNADAKTKVIIEPYPEKTLHGLKWYTVETYELTMTNYYTQQSRTHMSTGNFDLEYEWLTKPQMSKPLVDGEMVSLEAFTALVAALKF